MRRLLVADGQNRVALWKKRNISENQVIKGS